ncbi:HpcH/HpaI aldolase [Niveomyces insectorum RCEF 264]|uniref:HpcH/HpaI aldolase n=1 Tax=Niveomyces insectorum RCEF 264 TaxID=1081102 RepID=A0A167LW30_9HYPO|nr:HpcH/HpaI aldolase [Niveomyces insectorum RCEF 264]
MAPAFTNNLQQNAAKGEVCKVGLDCLPLNSIGDRSLADDVVQAFGIRLVANPQVVQLAANSGFDALFIDLEHSTLSAFDASILSMAGLQYGITPFVRVPYQCGDGFVQRVLDGGAMGVIFPHIHNEDDARAAVSICKYPPTGKRSMTGQVPYFSLRPTPPGPFVAESNAHASSVFVMIETKESIENVDSIAAVPDVDVLLIGSNDLATELGVPAQFKSDAFRAAVAAVSAACAKHGKVFGLAGIYDNAELQDWALNKLGARFILVQQDSGILARAGKESVDAILQVTSTK